LAPETHAAERLQQALDEAARAGNGAAPAPPELAGMLAVADRLRHAAASRSGMGGDPRPSFVLGLEEQLRTDLRLLPQPAAPAPPAWSGAALLLGATIVFAIGLVSLGRVERSLPGEALWPLRLGFEEARAAAATAPDPRAQLLLDSGWRHVQALERLVDAGEVPLDVLTALLRAATDRYGEALAVVDVATDARLRRRAEREIGDAAAVLAGAAKDLPVEQAAAVAVAEAALRAQLRGRGGIVTRPPVLSPGPGDPTALPPTPGATPSPSATPVPSATAATGVGATPAPTLTALPTRSPPTRSPPSATPSPPPPTTVASPPPATDEPTERPTRSSPATHPPPNTTVPTDVARTPPPDRWPTGMPTHQPMPTDPPEPTALPPPGDPGT
jgi:hypothetical protein